MKVFIGSNNPLLNPIQDDLVIHLEKNNIEISSNITECDIIPIIHFSNNGTTIEEQFKFIGSVNYKLLLLIECYDAVDTSNYKEYLQSRINPYLNYTNKVVLLHNNLSIDEYPFIFTDIIWNYVKTCFTEYEKFDLKYRTWSMNLSRENYNLHEIKLISPDKKFLIPNKVRYTDGLGFNLNEGEEKNNRNIYRKKLKNVILEEDCYFSDPENCIYLKPEFISQELFDSHFTFGNMGNTPIANYYYTNSIVSVYIETIASNYGGQLVTEKTFLPLLKGHFILPFSSPNFLAYLKEKYNFLLPAWIDYSYDEIVDDRERFHGFLRSFSKLRLTPLNDLVDNFNKDLWILKHNREIFFNRQYDSLADKLKIYINKIY